MKTKKEVERKIAIIKEIIADHKEIIDTDEDLTTEEEAEHWEDIHTYNTEIALLFWVLN